MKYNSAVVMYFKALIALADLFILQETGETPSSLSSRFRFIESEYPEIYSLLDKDFPFYQDSYVHSMSKELAEVIRDDARTMAEKTQVSL